MRAVVEEIGAADGALGFVGDGQVGLDANAAKDVAARRHGVALLDAVWRLLAYLYLADGAVGVEGDTQLLIFGVFVVAHDRRLDGRLGKADARHGDDVGGRKEETVLEEVGEARKRNEREDGRMDEDGRERERPAKPWRCVVFGAVTGAYLLRGM